MEKQIKVISLHQSVVGFVNDGEWAHFFNNKNDEYTAVVKVGEEYIFAKVQAEKVGNGYVYVNSSDSSYGVYALVCEAVDAFKDGKLKKGAAILKLAHTDFESYELYVPNYNDLIEYELYIKNNKPA